MIIIAFESSCDETSVSIAKFYKDENGKRNNNILYGYVVKTGESFIAFENEGSEKSLMYMGWDEKYLICRISLDGENYSHLAINIQTGEKTLLPY